MEKLKLNTYLEKCSIQRNLLKDGFILIITNSNLRVNENPIVHYYNSFSDYKLLDRDYFVHADYLDTLIGLRNLPIVFASED